MYLHTSYKIDWHNKVMKLGIRGKLFLVILLISLTIVISMLLFTRWSIHSGFTSYVEERQASRIEQISQRLIDHYDQYQSWQQLAKNKRAWLELLFGNHGRRARHLHDAHDDDDAHTAHMRHRPPAYRFLLRDGSTAWPPNRIMRKIQSNAPRVPFEVRLMLFDRNKNPVYGRLDQLADSTLFPLLIDSEAIGYLALISGPSLIDTGHLRFMQQQHSGLIWIGLGVILLSALISIILSKRLVNPVQEFRLASHELASGKYSRRVSIESSDELGDLARDINQLAESLQANEKARKQWAADIAHELRTPLAVIQGELEALQSGIRKLDEQAINSLHEDTLRLGRLIDDLYDLSITDLGALSYRKETISVNEILLDDVQSMQHEFDKAKIFIQLQLSATAGLTIHADSQRLSQLFMNLLKNSLRYTSPQGELLIHSESSNGQLRINFMDSSPGVPEATLPYLFDRLYRAEYSRNRVSGGTGLGLAIAKNIVLAHDGNIKAQAAPQGGLWVQVTFPVINTA